MDNTGVFPQTSTEQDLQLQLRKKKCPCHLEARPSGLPMPAHPELTFSQCLFPQAQRPQSQTTEKEELREWLPRAVTLKVTRTAMLTQIT